jgi:hypothetical protein
MATSRGVMVDDGFVGTIEREFERDGDEILFFTILTGEYHLANEAMKILHIAAVGQRR